MRAATLPVARCLAGTAGRGIEDLLVGPDRPARLLARFDRALYLSAGGGERVVALVARDGVALPNSVTVPVLSGARPFANTQDWRLGDGRMRSRSLDVVVDAWTDARPSLGALVPGRVRGALRALEAAVAADPPDVPCQELLKACTRRDRDSAREAADALVGLGAGLTPAGDDVLAGAIAAGLAVARASGDDGCVAFFAQLGDHVGTVAPGRTTSLSASLLWHASRGEMASPARQVVRALSGATQLGPAMDALWRVGHSSGRDLAAGIAIGARAATRDLFD